MGHDVKRGQNSLPRGRGYYIRKIFLKDIRKRGICMSNVIIFPKSYNGHMKFQHIICVKIENKSSIIL
jgi:hypothetical protein